MAAAPTRSSRRQALLDAAVRVFADKGFHAARVGDIAREAGVAYGLLYHYFPSKEDVLRTVFRETWGAMLESVHGIEAAGGPAAEQLRRVATVVLGSWKLNPDLVRVLVREVARSPQLEAEVAEIGHAMDALERIIRRGQETGELRGDLEPRIASWAVYGALEEILTGWVITRPPRDEDEVAEAVQTVVAIVLGGLLAETRARTEIG